MTDEEIGEQLIQVKGIGQVRSEWLGYLYKALTWT